MKLEDLQAWLRAILDESRSVVEDDTVEVSILVRVDVLDGKAYACGAAYPGATEDDLRERVNMDAEDNWTDDPRFTWVRARVPKPTVGEVTGEVEPS